MSKTKYKCFTFHNEDHFKRDFPERKKRTMEKLNENGEFAIASPEYKTAEALMLSKTCMKNAWILNSGCTYHMCPVKTWFEEITESKQGIVVQGNDNSCQVKGIGTIRLQMHDGINRILKDVRFLPELKRNLISLGTLESSVYELKLENRVLKVSRGSLLVIKGKKINSLYFLQAKTVIGSLALIQELKISQVYGT